MSENNNNNISDGNLFEKIRILSEQTDKISKYYNMCRKNLSAHDDSLFLLHEEIETIKNVISNNSRIMKAIQQKLSEVVTQLEEEKEEQQSNKTDNKVKEELDIINKDVDLTSQYDKSTT